jgi:hypothetical protein
MMMGSINNNQLTADAVLQRFDELVDKGISFLDKNPEVVRYTHKGFPVSP